MKVIWAPLAIERAYEAAQFIAQDKPEAALKWLDGLFHCTDRLERSHNLAGSCRRLAHSSIARSSFRRSYRVVYRVEKTRVAILTVRSCAQLLDEEELSR